jgi:MFS family permease
MWLLASISNIVIGWFTCKYGYEWMVIFFGSILSICAHSIYLFMPDCNQCWESVLPLMVLGVAYSIFSVILYMKLPTLVDHSMMGTAMGITGVLLNLISVIIPPLIGKIKDSTQKNHGYFWTEVAFVFFSTVPLIINMFIYLSVKKH